MDTECSQAYEYDLGHDEKSYIYQNDLKYVKYNNINVNNVKDLPTNYDYSTVEIRIDDCIKNNYELLDLNHLELNEFPIILQQKNNLHNIKHLFISNNNINIFPNLSFFKHLVVIDISNNNLSVIPQLPFTIEELTIKNNNIHDERLDLYKSLKRLDISNNKLTSINVIKSLEILMCDDNNITKINSYPKLKKLSCERNNIKTICSSPNLKIISCEENKINTILNFPKLEELYCNDNRIIEINNLPIIKILCCIHNKLDVIEYFNTLRELTCDYNSQLSISKKYNVKSSHVYGNYVCILL